MTASVEVSIRRGKGRDGTTALAAAAAALLLLLLMDKEAADEEEGPLTTGPGTEPGTRGENLPGALGGGRDGCIVLGAISKQALSEA